MPVPTETFWNIRKLNILFAASALLLLGSMLWLIKYDHDRAWRHYQQEGNAWDAAMTHEAEANALNAGDKKELADLTARLAALTAKLKDEKTLQVLNHKLVEDQKRKATLDLPMRAVKGEITPLAQLVEKARLAHGSDSRQYQDEQKKLAAKQAEYEKKYAEMSQLDIEISDTTKAINDETEAKTNLQKEITDLLRKQKAAQDKLAKLEPNNLLDTFAAGFRNAPLSDWFNPSERVQQVVVQDVRTDMNFLTVETVDRCQTCHVNIDNPKYEEATLLLFVERQVAVEQGQDVNVMPGSVQPVVMLDFWVKAAMALAERPDQRENAAKFKAVNDTALQSLNDTRAKAGLKPLASADQMVKELIRLTQHPEDSRNKAGEVTVAAGDWYATAYYYLNDLRGWLAKSLGKDGYHNLMSVYRYALIGDYNGYRAGHGQKPLPASEIMLAHPNLKMYVDNESKHPMKTMGCTVCHEGSGQETAFEHTAHTPRRVYVDEKTGAVVPEFLLRSEGQEKSPPPEGGKVAAVSSALSGFSLDGAQAAMASSGESAHSAEAHEGKAVYSQYDVKLTEPGHPAPFAPQVGELERETHYLNPATGKVEKAVPQEEFWTHNYGFEEVHYMHWEKPMHRLDYVESSCARCHSEIFDIRDEAPKLFEGRKLFAQLGCANCHQVDAIVQNAMDFKKVGPSLAHVKEKLSPEMMSSWIWSPKAFRPMTRMPHFFMLENNSSPVDILRTRTEVAAITYYLLHTEPSIEIVLRDQQALESDLAGNPSSAAAAETRNKLDKSDADLKDLRSQLVPGNPEDKLNDIIDEQHKLHLELGQSPAPDRINPIMERLAQIHATLTAHVHTYSLVKPPSEPGDPKRGQLIFNTVGCLACHTNMNEFGERWITDDLVKRTGASRDEAKKQFAAMSYNQQHWYAMEHLQDKLMLIGPELSGVGTKLKAGRTADQARAWVFDWVRNPRHYSSYSIMPNFRLNDPDANDLAAYLLTLERPDYQPVDFLKLDERGDKMLAELAANFKSAAVPIEYARQVIAGEVPDPDSKTGEKAKWSADQELLYVGKKVITHYGCNGCHLINGFEKAASACAQLDDWGLKNPHMLDFGYFDHAFDKDREKPLTMWKVAHEGLASDAPSITSEKAKGPDAEVHQVSVKWEDLPEERRPWLYNKLHNTRIYDRARVTFEGSLHGDSFEIGRPYDKLKMPKFFLTDPQVRALVTYVTSVRKPLVTDSMRSKTYSLDRMRLAKGRQLATMYNCYGCHNIEGNDVHLHEFLPVHNPDGSEDVQKDNDFAPPRLIGEGARVQPEWLHDFLLNVRPIRPWLMVRMPSFSMSDVHETNSTSGGAVDNASQVVEFFAGSTALMGKKLATILQPIEDFINKNPGKDWFDQESLGEPVGRLQEFLIKMDEAKASDFDPRQWTVEDMRPKWKDFLDNARFLREVYDIHFPFPEPPKTSGRADGFARGELLFGPSPKGIGCVQCHSMGDDAAMTKLYAATTQPAPAPATTQEEDNPYGEAPAAKPAAPAAAAAAAAAPGAAASDDYGSETPSASAAEESPDLDVPMLPNPHVISGPGYAPNLIHVSERLQYNWVDHWIRRPPVVHVGTRMPLLLDPNGESVFAKSPDRAAKEAIYGDTGELQRRFLLDFIFGASKEHFTFNQDDLLAHPPTPSALPPTPKPVAAPLGPRKSNAALPGTGNAAAAPEKTAAAPPPPKAPKPDVEVSTIKLQDSPTATSETTRIVGVVTFTGKPPPHKVISMQQDAVCMAAHANGPPPLYPVSKLVNSDGTMRNVFVYVKSGLEAVPGGSYPLPPEAELVQQGCEYHPHVLGVMAGQKIKVVNDDNTTHNINIQPKLNVKANFSQGPGVEDTTKFTKPEMAVLMKCDVHPWMSGYVYVMSHPFFAVTDAQGRYEIKGLPPGKYTLEAMVEPDPAFKVAPVTFDVTVENKTSSRADATLKR